MELKTNSQLSNGGLHHVGNATDIKGNESIKRIYSIEGKSPTLTTSMGGHREPKVAVNNSHYRKLLPIECERLQTLPDNYTSMLSNSQRYKSIGNGWTVDVIKHIFKNLPNRELTVLSLFDGISCGRIALDRAGKTVKKYYASEVDKYAIKCTQENWQNTIQIGDVCKVTYKDGILSTEYGDYNVGKIDIVIGGSPCQSFSVAGDGSGFEGNSGLFWEFIRVLKEVNPTYFLLENVVMKKEWQKVIDDAIGIEPIKINSSLVSAQSRNRLYWTNIQGVAQPKDKGILLKDILEPVTDPKFDLSQTAIEYMSRLRNGKPRWEYHKNPINGKAACLTANMCKGVPYGVLQLNNKNISEI